MVHYRCHFCSYCATIESIDAATLVGGVMVSFLAWEGKQYRLFGLIFIFLLVFYISQKFGSQMLVSACFPLFAAGAVWLEKIFNGLAARSDRSPQLVAAWLKPVYTGLLLLSGIVIAPSWVPVLPLPVLEKYLNVTANSVISVNAPGEIPFGFAFELGWPEMVKEIAAVYHSLPETDRRQCVIWASDYPEAAAIDFFGKTYGLPSAISNHLAYQMWGPGHHTGAVVIAFGRGYGNEAEMTVFTKIQLLGVFNEVTYVKAINGHKYGPWFEKNLPVFICRKPTSSLKEIWQWHEDYR